LAVAWLFYARAARQQQGQMRDSFAAMAAEALDANSRRLAEMAGTSLEAKKELIDQAIAAMNERLERVRGFLQQVESERQKHYGELTTSLAALSGTTESLRKALAGSKRVGEWGERMTEDVLRLVGMQEGVNYLKQSPEAAEAGRPDYTFLLPNELVVNMDVKFPLDKCLDYLNAADDQQRQARAKGFVTAVRNHVRDVASPKRGYVNTSGGTVNYVIVFIPNEQVYSLAMELAPGLMDEALKMRVVLCGPLTLYAMLAVVRAAAENANIMKTADEVIGLLSVFNKQWQRYKEAMDMMGRRIDEARKEYENLVGTRTRMLERPLEKVEELRTARGLAAPTEDPPAGPGRETSDA
jgi:DNA recombination protein RmuC